jgi:N-acetylmuramoyl-L-alanine amidase
VIGKIEYISLGNFKNLNKKIEVNWNPLLLTAELHYGKNKIRFQADTRFFVSNSDAYSLKDPPVFYKNDLYLPRELVEEIITELSIPVNFKFEEKNLKVQEDKPVHRAKAGLDFIMIDPGHGGKDPGAFGFSRVMEKDITIKTSLYLYEYLKKQFPGVKIYISRQSDTFVSLEKRSDIANKKLNRNGLGIFISIHCNSTIQRNIHGYEVFYLSQTPGSEEDRRVMMRENDIISAPEPEISMIESYLLNSQVLSESKMLARQINRALLTQMDGVVSSRGVRKADFKVLRRSLMPAVLLEIGYISNKNEAEVLQSSKFREKLAVGISEAINNFIKKRPGI